MITISGEDIKYIRWKANLSRMEGSSVLLLGSNGFLGRWIYDVLSDMKVDLVCVDNDIATSDTKAEYIKHNIIDRFDDSQWNRTFDYIINCAGIASPERYMEYPIETLDVSYIGTKNVLEYADRIGVRSVITFSSSEVYGTPTPDMIPTPETYKGNVATMSNRSCYDIGKQVLETLSHTYFDKYDVPVRVIRPFNMYGPHMGLKDNRVLSNWMNNYIDNIPLKVYGHGNQTRTFCYAGDGIAMTFGILLDGENGEVYNIGNPEPEVSMLEMAEIFARAMDGHVEVRQIEYPDFYPSDEPQRRCPDISKVVETTGIEPTIGFDIGLKRMYEYFLDARGAVV